MRSRYSAYSLGKASYILKTTHPQSPFWEEDRVRWLQDVRQFCQATRFEGLLVKGAETQGDRAWVEFHALLSQGQQDTSFTEKSLFLLQDGLWFYHSLWDEFAGTVERPSGKD